MTDDLFSRPLRAAEFEFQRRYVQHVFAQANGNTAQAAKLAKVDWSNFRRLLRKCGVERAKSEAFEYAATRADCGILQPPEPDAGWEFVSANGVSGISSGLDYSGHLDDAPSRTLDSSEWVCCIWRRPKP